MERYRVLLVDDEEDIRVGISRKMDWESLGFTLVGEAENGQEALELAEALPPTWSSPTLKCPFWTGWSFAASSPGGCRRPGLWSFPALMILSTPSRPSR